MCLCQISAGNTVYLLAAGPTIFIALTGTVALKMLNHVLTASNGDSNQQLFRQILKLYQYSDNYVLWGGNIALLIGIVATTLSFVRTMYEAYIHYIHFLL